MEVSALCIRLYNNGEYWYEPEAGRRSNIINLSVTAGPVILESPAVPLLMEETVTLSCRMKNPSTNFKADFYKNGRLIHRSFTGNMTIHRIFKSDEGFYKCKISGVGESPESWLKVTDNNVCHSSSAATPCIITTILVSALLVAVGLHHFGKGYWKRETGTVDADRETNAAVRKTGDEDTLPSKPSCHSVGLGDTQPQGSWNQHRDAQQVPANPKQRIPSIPLNHRLLRESRLKK
ncbi:low affinity immunoglobulin gamma Fc region receptor II-like isoform X2 [Oreochromis aureus]|uniref:low affinity immunoglobulin gamma Fc region receptor II-like isoform X2 n=1 Tax=Oreochromis aureus TaxID=47969 RepID=UPI001954B224|nr:low affinity immunoglobulin gamma Fc region receptor II-like isoform X2 [Oreochromis aureus]